MPLDQFLIAPMVEGMRTDVEPWLIPEEAFAGLRNAYVWRGRVRKRHGSSYLDPSTVPTAGLEQLSSRLRINLGAVRNGTIPGAITVGRLGQMFSIGAELFTVYQPGNPADMLHTGPATTFSFDTTTGAYIIVTATVGDLFFYPADPVMGLLNYEDAAINDEPTFAFDTQFAYEYTAVGWDRLGTGIWTGSDSEFFWGLNYRGINAYDTLLFVTNNNETDHVRYWNGATWTTFQPAYSTTPTDTINGCRLIVAFQERILFLNTWESVGGAAANNYPFRIRFSQEGSPVEADAWYQNPETIGKGSWIDLETKEAIISAKILRNRLIVFCERSTWELVWNNNKVRPFTFQRINAELGVESTFSSVLFDKAVLGVGNVGIHACNGANVDRVDNKIPQLVFRIHNGNEGVERVYGIRDYDAEMVYWAIPSAADVDPTFPTKVLVYNYHNKSWAIYDDSITCFGYFQSSIDDSWADLDEEWQTNTNTWSSASFQSGHREIIAGNQQGYTFIFNQDNTRNAGALQITELTDTLGSIQVTIIDHNLLEGDYILVEDVQGATGFSGIYKIVTWVSDNEFIVHELGFGGTYTGGGTAARVSKIEVLTKEYNFYQRDGLNMLVPKVSFYVDKTQNGAIFVDFYSSSSNRSLVEDGEVSGAALSSSILETTAYPDTPYENTQKRFWHVLYPQAEGEVIQMHLYFTDEQMLDEDLVLSDFNLNAISIYSRRVHRY